MAEKFRPVRLALKARTTIRDIIRGTSAAELEKSFRQYSALLAESDDENRFISCDGKVFAEALIILMIVRRFKF